MDRLHDRFVILFNVLRGMNTLQREANYLFPLRVDPFQ